MADTEMTFPFQCLIYDPYLKAQLDLRDRMRSLGISREIEIELLLLRVKRSQLRWFRTLIRIPPDT